MVVLSAAICTKSGKPLLARQFVPMTKIRVESLLAAFPKLVGTDTDAQHTFVETESVRYVYQPVEQLYMLLITNKASNIIEDLDTLRLIVKLIPEYCGGVTEQAVTGHSFDLIFAIDEVISIGYKENVTVQQIKTFTDMDSHEEKLHKIITESKINEAREAARAKAQAIDKRKAEERKLIGAAGAGWQGISSETYRSNGGSSMSSEDNPESDTAYGQDTYGSDRAPSKGPAAAGKSKKPVEKEVKQPAKKPTKGMTLSKATTNDVASAILQEEFKRQPALVAAAAAAAGPVAAPIQHQHPVVLVKETVSVVMDREGAVESLEVKGLVKVVVNDPDDTRIKIATVPALDKKDGFQSRLDPKLDRDLYASSGTLAYKDSATPFKTGNDNATVLLKYRKLSKNEKEVPLTINFWPNPDDGMTAVTVEVDHVNPKLQLQGVIIEIPCPSSEPPEVTSHTGEWSYNPKSKVLLWRLGELNQDNSQARLEFQVSELDSDEFFPLKVSFSSSDLFSGLQITSVADVESGAEKEFTVNATLSAEDFQVK